MLPFTPRLRTAIAYAETRRPHEVSCLALLAGIMSLGGGVAVNILKSRGFPESGPVSVPPGDQVAGDSPVQYRPCGLAALSGAISEALRTSHQLVGVEHMLAGLLVSACPEVTELFAQKGVSLDETLSELRRNM
jgi:Clp amino terminal domain, pathogenicity island component